jgi:hypothetical protein
MNNDNEKKQEIERNLQENKLVLRKKYHKPELEKLGDLRSFTLMGSIPSPSDSGLANYSWE